jgi:hypothetical protein
MLAMLAGLVEQHREAQIVALHRRLLDTTTERSAEADVQQIYRVILQREADAKGLQKHVMAVRAGLVSREGVIDLLKGTSEYARQRARVLVVPDHPSFNASTLRYYAEAERRPLSFFHIQDGPIAAERLRLYDFVLVKSSGYQGPEFSTQYNAEIMAYVELEDSGFARLPQNFAFPDDTQIVVFAAKSMSPQAREQDDGEADAGKGL